MSAGACAAVEGCPSRRFRRVPFVSCWVRHEGIEFPSWTADVCRREAGGDCRFFQPWGVPGAWFLPTGGRWSVDSGEICDGAGDV